jgi:DNA-binding LacI/PurR family transcriptional regulator
MRVYGVFECMTTLKHKPAVPKHVQIRDRLRDRILNEWTPGTRLPTEAELFKELGVSSTTVVRALNDLVREGVIHRRRGSGTYVADWRNPPLIPGRPLKIGILWMGSVSARSLDSFNGQISLGALKAWGVNGSTAEFNDDSGERFTRTTLRQAARGLTVECVGNELGGYNRAPALEVVAKAGYDGVMTVGIIEEGFLSNLLDLGIPTVIVDFPTQRLGSRADLVYADPQIGYRAAVDSFVERGLRRIHFVGARIWDPHTKIPDPTHPRGYRFGKRIDPDTFLRLSAYRQALDAHGIDARADWVHYQTEEDTELAGRLAALGNAERPQALLCHDIKNAERLIRSCGELGLQLQAAGASSDSHASPAMHIRLDTKEMGSVSGELLLARIKQPARPFLNVGVRMALMQQDDSVQTLSSDFQRGAKSSNQIG